MRYNRRTKNFTLVYLAEPGGRGEKQKRDKIGNVFNNFYCDCNLVCNPYEVLDRNNQKPLI